MQNSLTTEKKRTLNIIQQSIPYYSDPTDLFHTLCGHKKNSLLLESAEIESKENLKSLLLIDSAVRIVCFQQDVTFEALTENGYQLISFLATQLDNTVEHTITKKELTIHFQKADNTLDEDNRLKEPSSFDALRMIQHHFESDGYNKYALFIGGLFAYDLVANFEPLGNAIAANQCPDFVFYVAETLLVIDHKTETCQLQGTIFDNNESLTALINNRITDIRQQCLEPQILPDAIKVADMTVSTSVSDEDYCQTVTDLKEYIVQGDIFQIVPSRIFSLPCPSPLAAYKNLKANNPSPYMFYMQDTLFTLFGASPESAIKYEKETNQVEIYPIAGTRGRGKNVDGSINLDLDGRIELELRSDKKENAEHMMLVDLARNDVARISEPGTRHLADQLKVDRYSHVMHLVSRVVGQLRSDLDALHAYQASMNMGTLTGAPKIRAMQLIRQYEKKRRGSYGGAVGYLTGHGDLDTCIVIRSAYVENGRANVQAGAGVVYDSIPQFEADESRGKAQAVISAIQSAHQMK